MHEVCASLLVALEPTPGESRSEARSLMKRCAPSFHFHHCKIQVKNFNQSANKAYTICKRDIHTNLKTVTVGKCLASRGKDSPTPCPNPIHTPVTDMNLSRAWLKRVDMYTKTPIIRTTHGCEHSMRWSRAVKHGAAG
jgi:hypothetical protein